VRIRISFLVIVLSASWISAQTTPQWGSYPERPLNLIDLIPPDGRRFSLGHDFDYIDPSGRAWHRFVGENRVRLFPPQRGFLAAFERHHSAILIMKVMDPAAEFDSRIV